MPPLRRSRSKVPIEKLLEATTPVEPVPWSRETDMSVGGVLDDVLDILFHRFFSILD